MSGGGNGEHAREHGRMEQSLKDVRSEVASCSTKLDKIHDRSWMDNMFRAATIGLTLNVGREAAGIEVGTSMEAAQAVIRFLSLGG